MVSIQYDMFVYLLYDEITLERELKMNKENVKLWIDALRSGEYNQSRGTLQDQHGFCCLGVACKVAEKNNIKVIKDNVHNVLMHDIIFCEQTYVSDWLGMTSELEETLVELNDGEKYTFGQIADYLEEKLNALP